ncbi:MAG: EAL domain-containing protein [Gordonibacter sp.]
MSITQQASREDSLLLERQYRERIKPQLEHSPCTAYVVKQDIDFSFVEGNDLFFSRPGFSQEELAQKLGYRLGALLDKDSLQATGKLVEKLEFGQSGTLYQRILYDGKSYWVLTSIARRESEIGPVLHCTSVDISFLMDASLRDELRLDNFQHAAEEARLGAFQYDPADGTARLFGSPDLLPMSPAGDSGTCPHFIDRFIEEIVVPDDDAATLRAGLSLYAVGQERCSYEFKAQTRKGKPAWTRLTLSSTSSASQHPHRIIGVLEDITQQKETALAYLRETQFFQALLSEQDAYGQIDVTENRILRVGGIWNLYNEIIDKMAYTDLFHQFIDKVVHTDDRRHCKEFMRCENFIESLDNGISTLECELRRIVDQNKMVWMKLSVHLFKDPLSRHVFGLLHLRSIEAQKKQELAALHHSTFDQLTDIYNKRAAQSAIGDYLATVSSDEPYAFMIIDFDSLKAINDNLGHNVGNRVLIKFAHILNSMFRKNDIVGRFGGDEFILFIKGVSTHEQVRRRLDEFDAVLMTDVDADLISCCIGIICAKGPNDYENLFRRADVALYEAKIAGKGSRRFFDQESTPLLDRRKESEEDEVSVVQPVAWDRLDLVCSRNEEGASYRAINELVGEQGDIAYLVDVDSFTLLRGNKAFYDRIGMTEQQCKGRTCYELMHRRESPCPFCGKANWATDKYYLWRNYNLVLEQEFLIKNKLVNWNGREVLLALAVDISNNKSIVDSLETGSMEMHAILEGVQRMTGADTLDDVVATAIETIGTFFRAGEVRLWHHSGIGEPLECARTWPRNLPRLDAAYEHEVRAWVEGMSWEHPLNFETPEAMLCHSYGMYEHMKMHGTRNQRWLRIMGGEGEHDFISIDNLSCDLQNVSFLSSFTVFLENELNKRSLAEKTIHTVLHDNLTDLLSRRSFESFVAEYDPDLVANLGIVVANIDHLKRINELHGFQTGSQYIKEFAGILRKALPGYTLYRLDGDEFLAVALDTSLDDVQDAVRSLEALVKENGCFTVSVGCSWDDIEKNLPQLIEQATVVMQSSKKLIHDSSDERENTSHRKMLSDLMTALDNGDFKVFLQPKVDLASKEVIGAEALIRFQNDELGIVPPGKFIDALEKNDLIRYIDLFVLEEVCKLLENWKSKGFALPVVSLNFSRFTLLERNIAASIEAIVSQYDVAKRNIEVEITESAVVIGKSVLYQAAQDLHQAGYSISLDDFGTKYTNLSILVDIDFDVLKIDRSLIAEVEKKKGYRAILESVIDICDSLGIKVVAEGIETKAQEAVLREANCKFAQGYLYGKPMPATEFEAHCFGGAERQRG